MHCFSRENTSNVNLGTRSQPQVFLTEVLLEPTVVHVFVPWIFAMISHPMLVFFKRFEGLTKALDDRGRPPNTRTSAISVPQTSILGCFFSAIYLWGRSGRGHCRKCSQIFRKISTNFRGISTLFPTASVFLQIFRRSTKLSAKTPSLTTP